MGETAQALYTINMGPYGLSRGRGGAEKRGANREERGAGGYVEKGDLFCKRGKTTKGKAWAQFPKSLMREKGLRQCENKAKKLSVLRE